ncbi:MAG TPA: glycosyl transferase family 90 [Paracoccus solventivorans]|uniref:glycosyl transferase family 90 n=1 Tax=Paracoccus solventivorans TaxID=53463 RepID=UPI002B714AA2|nr:glycosyl transferase family 90 [Paracoccus solventivorans]HMM07772.1 glycosyl transferase family 90 [Paracoccus solventivorans]
MTARIIPEQEFVESSVRLMLGSNPAGFARGEAAMLRALKGSSASAVAILPTGSRHTLSRDGSRLKSPRPEVLSPRALAAIEDIDAFQPRFSYIVDMWDRRIRSTSDGAEPPFPVFSFNRITGEPGRVLWPLAGFHDAGSRGFLGHLDPGRVSWEDKLPKVVWRGGTGGRTIGSSPGRGEGMRLISALRRYQAGTLGRRKLERVICGTHRWQVLDRVKDDPRFDLGFVDSADYIISETPLHQHLERPRLTPEEMQRFRYIAVLRGNDVGSSFYWTMNSGSVGLVQDTPYETFASGHFRPWEHYIPFAEDGSDLPARLDWAESHLQECRAMVRRAAAVCAFLDRPDLRAAVLGGVIRRVGERMHATPAWRVNPPQRP